MEELSELVGRAVTMEEHIMVVGTRAGKQRCIEEERLAREPEVLSGVTPTPLVSGETPDAYTADSADTSIHTPTVTTPDTHTHTTMHTPVKLTKKQRREVQQAANNQGAAVHSLDLRAQDFQWLQEEDSSLEAVRAAADGGLSTAGQ